jgi:hypothetical protein
MESSIGKLFILDEPGRVLFLKPKRNSQTVGIGDIIPWNEVFLVLDYQPERWYRILWKNKIGWIEAPNLKSVK